MKGQLGFSDMNEPADRFIRINLFIVKLDFIVR